MTTISKLFGERVALELVDEEYTGLIVPAPTEQKMHMLGRIVAVGDKAKRCKVGDIVFWQWNAMMDFNNKYSIGGKVVFVLHEGDMIARLAEGTAVTLANFSVIGNWCLVTKATEEKVGRFFIPGASVEQSSPAPTHYHLAKVDALQPGQEMAVGDEVVVDRTKANRLAIDGQEYCYILNIFVLGVLQNSK